jgi:ribosomal protein S18 acetylase RimI-like enzyme
VSAATGLIDAIEAYYDAAPRTAAHAESVGPFTLFVGTGAWGYYARPTLGLRRTITPEDVAALRARQRELDMGQEIEWQPSVTPGLADACAAAGMRVHSFRLLVHDRSLPQQRTGVRIVGPEDDLAAWVSVQQQGFGASAEVDAATVDHLAARLGTGASRMAAAFVDGRPVCVGVHQPVGDVTEVVGVATLPTARRQGWAGAVTHALVADARGLGVSIVFLSAADDAVARVYERVGFRDVGQVCAAEPAD